MRAARFIAPILALALGACGDTCSRGPTTTCWCPGDTVGQSTCDADGIYGACACPSAPASSVPLAPPPITTTQPVLQPMHPSDVAPVSALTPTFSREAEIAAWIAAPLRGHDNRMAAMRRVTIRGTEGAYTIAIDNQFGFRCGLDFDQDGMPSALRGCVSREPDWSATPDLIAVTCAREGTDIECQAPYSLSAGDGHASREIILFRRRAS